MELYLDSEFLFNKKQAGTQCSLVCPPWIIHFVEMKQMSVVRGYK